MCERKRKEASFEFKYNRFLSLSSCVGLQSFFIGADGGALECKTHQTFNTYFPFSPPTQARTTGPLAPM